MEEPKIGILLKGLKDRNSLPNDKILDWTKFTTFTDDKLAIGEIMISVFQ